MAMMIQMMTIQMMTIEVMTIQMKMMLLLHVLLHPPAGVDASSVI